MTKKELNSELNPFFYPKNVAVVGVSSKKTNIAKIIVRNLMTMGYKGQVFPVGSRGGRIFNGPIYKSFDQIGCQIDQAVIMTPAKVVPEILEQCGRAGIRCVVIESGGFSETSKDGKTLEDECIRIAEKYMIRILGPNCIGVTNMENGLVQPFLKIHKDIKLGSLSMIAQSGGVGFSYLGALAEEGLGLNKFISIGNKLNLDENDMLAYLVEDKGTEIILVYLESFKDGRRFMEIVSGSEKPILVHKANRFVATSNIARSHTAALFGNDKIVGFALEQSGCVRINSVPEAIDFIKTLLLPPLKGNRLGVISPSGGHAVVSTDACAKYKFVLPELPVDFLQSIESKFKSDVIHLQNPMDLGDLFDLSFYEYIIKGILESSNIDGILLIHFCRTGFEREITLDLFKKIQGLMEQYNKPVGTVLFADSSELSFLRQHLRMPFFSGPENVAKAFHLSLNGK